MLSFQSKLLCIALLEGATVMVIQLLFGQMLTPFFGAGLHTWAAVIGTTISCLALGYYIGGYWAKNNTSHTSLYWILWIAAAWIMVMPGVSKMSIYALSKTHHLGALIGICIVLLPPVLILLGTVPILLIKSLTHSTEGSGLHTGRVYTVSTIGGIAGILICGFYTLPAYGITITTLATGLLLGGAATLGLMANRKPIALAFLFILPLGWMQIPRESTQRNIRLLHHSEGLLGQVMVADIAAENEVTRGLFVNRIAQSYVNPSNMKPSPTYIKGITQIASNLPDSSDILIIGLAGGSLSNQLLKLGHKITAIELDARLPQLAHTYFGLSESIQVIIDDGRHFVETTHNKYDLIIVDAFRGEAIPGHLLTIEAFRQIRSLLLPGGQLAVNFNGFIEGPKGKGGRSVIRTMETAGFYTVVYVTRDEPLYRNSLYLGITQPNSSNTAPLQYEEIPLSHQPTPDLGNALLLSDDLPIMDLLNLPAARAWRTAYNQSFTSAFSANGVPLFK